MSDARSSRLRPFAGRFDLRMNKNRFGLIRRTIKRVTNTKVLKQKIDINNNETNKEVDNEMENEAKTVKNIPVATFMVKAQQTSFVRRWKLSDQQLRHTAEKKPPSLYDTSKPRVQQLDENSLFKHFDNLTLDELSMKAEENVELRLAAQKYFEVVYTSMNMDWLIDKNAEKFSLPQAERLLKIFGHFMSSLIVNSDHLAESDQQGQLLELISVHYSGILFWNSKH